MVFLKVGLQEIIQLGSKAHNVSSISRELQREESFQDMTRRHSWLCRVKDQISCSGSGIGRSIIKSSFVLLSSHVIGEGLWCSSPSVHVHSGCVLLRLSVIAFVNKRACPVFIVKKSVQVLFPMIVYWQVRPRLIDAGNAAVQARLPAANFHKRDHFTARRTRI